MTIRSLRCQISKFWGWEAQMYIFESILLNQEKFIEHTSMTEILQDCLEGNEPEMELYQPTVLTALL